MHVRACMILAISGSDFQTRRNKFRLGTLSSPHVVTVGHAARSEMAGSSQSARISAAWQRQLQMVAPASHLEGDARNVAIELKIAVWGGLVPEN